MEVGAVEQSDAGPLVIDWPVVSVLIGGDRSSPATRHTAASVEHSLYPGEVQVLTGYVDEAGTPAEIANGHMGEARGRYVLPLFPGITLDPHCIRYAVERITADPSTVAVAFQWRRPDGRLLEAGGHLTSEHELIPWFRATHMPEWLRRVPYPTPVSTFGSLLMRSQAFFSAGGFNLDLDGSPYQAAHLALGLTADDGHVEVEPRAIAFAPPGVWEESVDVTRDRNLLEGDFGARLDRLRSSLPDTADLGMTLSRREGPRVLWAATHLPDSTRSGVDARHLEMIQALVDAGNEVVVWAIHTDGADTKQLEALGVRWVARTQPGRWDLRPDDETHPWLEDVIRQVPWDRAIVSEPGLLGRIGPLIRHLSPGTALVVDLATVRFPAAHDHGDGNHRAHPPDIPDITDADAVVTATVLDMADARGSMSGIPISAYAALGIGEPPRVRAAAGPPLFIGNLLHRPNAQAIEWWIDAIASRVEGRVGTPVPLRVVGYGSEIYRDVWNHPAKVDLVGWRPTLTRELDTARLLVVPVPHATGTGGRMFAALSRALPVVASAPAAAMLGPELSDLVSVGHNTDELGDHIARLLTDDDAWSAAHSRLAALDFTALRRNQQSEFSEWLANVRAAPQRTAGGL